MFQPDLNAPRKPRKSRKKLLTKETYLKYRKSENYNSFIKDFETFKKVIESATDCIKKEVQANQNGVELFNIGLLLMVAVPTLSHDKYRKRSYYDPVNSSKYNTLITYNNFHTDGKMLNIVFTQLPRKFKYNKFENWAFSAVRNFRRECSVTFRKDYNKYISKSKGEFIENIVKFMYE